MHEDMLMFATQIKQTFSKPLSRYNLHTKFSGHGIACKQSYHLSMAIHAIHAQPASVPTVVFILKRTMYATLCSLEYGQDKA